MAAGYDLHSAYDYEIPAQGKVIAKTDLQIRVPDGTYGRVAPRSGLAAKHFIDIGAGVVDQDYTYVRNTLHTSTIKLYICVLIHCSTTLLTVKYLLIVF